jgi:hypothetical protein
VFTWSQHAAPPFVGRVAGTRLDSGYSRIHVAGHYVYAHRLAFAFVHGRWSVSVTPLDGDRTNNRAANLRESTAQQRNWSARKTVADTTSRFKGVYWCRRKRKWHARIRVGPSTKHLGFFDVEEAAGAAYARAAAQVAGEFARTN